MAKGDTVSAIGVTGSELTFQPASGVEVCITHCGGYNTWIMFYNGTTSSHLVHTNDVTSQGGVTDILKTQIMLNNTNYLRIGSRSGYAMSYSGVQIK